MWAFTWLPYVCLCWPPIFEWYMASFVVKNGHQNDKYDNEIESCPSYYYYYTVNNEHDWEDLYDHFDLL